MLQVIDPFMGTGSTLLAAHTLGLHAIGGDKDKKCTAAAKFLETLTLDSGSPYEWRSGLDGPDITTTAKCTPMKSQGYDSDSGDNEEE